MENNLFVNEICEQSIKKIAEGDLTALSVIYDCAGRLIFTVAFSILGDYQLSQDVMQDTFIHIADKAHTYRKGSNAKAWIVSIGRNLALNVLKERKHVSCVEDCSYKVIYPITEEKLITSITLSDALACLQSQEREIVVYKTMCNLSHNQIAGLMDITIPNSRQKYKRALEKLRCYYFNKGGVINVRQQEN
ncbi:MAG: hypothetical protein A2Y15_08030 [Clostridiales bacterium GWF2_36_10]|nr:MAG: hypothetical protein A2Y15_08030 [Clostridiales bacterium GWF2_36_10]HAN20376.1 hypothetical protein [Clostridiales bacterium]